MRQIALEYREVGFCREQERITRRETLRRGEIFARELERTLAQLVAVAEQPLPHARAREVGAHERGVPLDRAREQRLDLAPRLSRFEPIKLLCISVARTNASAASGSIESFDATRSPPPSCADSCAATSPATSLCRISALTCVLRV